MARPSFPKHDLYKVLGVESTASLDDIKKAYRDLCKRVHPDKAEGGSTPENNARFQQIQEAWEILRDEVLRREYDDYRANGAKDSSHREARDDSGRRHRTRKDWEERSGDTYGSKPNRQRKPYYEKWGDTYYDDGPYETSEGGPYPFSRFRGQHFGSGPARGTQHESYEEHHVPKNPRGPPHAVKLEDRIVTMRLRVDMRQVSRELDNLHADIRSFSKTFVSHEFSETCRWCTLLDGVNVAFDSVEDLYDVLQLRLKEVEAAHSFSSVTAHHLPELLGVLQAHITRMKYSATAVLVILDQLSQFPPPAAERWLLEDLELRLRTMLKAKWIPSDWHSI